MTESQKNTGLERELKHWDNPDCLHCRLVQTIYGFFEDQGGRVHGETLLDMQLIMESVGQVAAEFFAAQPYKGDRDRRLKELHHAIRDAIPEIRVRGEGAYPKLVRSH